MPNSKSKEKMTINEAMRRLRPFFIAVMSFPLLGMLAAIIIIYKIQPKNLMLLEALMFLVILIYVASIYLIVKRMGELGMKSSG